MTQISRRPIKPQLSERMYELLWKSLIKIGSSETAIGFLEDVLTPTERVMLAKRLAIALLLSRGWDQEAIGNYLKVSTSTVSLLKNKLASSSKGYIYLISQIENDKQWQAFILDLNQTLSEILAGRKGAGWKRVQIMKTYALKRAKQKIL